MAIEFGWVVRSTSRTAGNTRAMREGNERFMEALRPPFTTVWVEDHFQWEDLPTLEAWTAMAYIAGQYPHLKVGTLTLGQSYRNPALTAKMAATLQWLSSGRLILGIGAGWKEDEHHAYGYPFPSAGMRIAELREVVQIIRAMWCDSPATFHGEHYRIEDAYCEPRPAPAPPILIGGGGERKTLRVVAELADWWNVAFSNLENFRRKVDILHRHCADVGRNPAEIALSYYGLVAINRDPAKVEPLNPVQSHIYRVAGTPDEVAAELNAFIAFGVTHFMLKFADFPSTEGYELFMEEVVPNIQTLARDLPDSSE